MASPSPSAAATTCSSCAIEALEPLVVGRALDEILADLGGFWPRTRPPTVQLRWLGPEKGVMHMAIGAVVNAAWDLVAKRAGKPLWQLLADMSPEQLVGLVDFRYLTDALTPDEALEILRPRRAGPGRSANSRSRQGLSGVHHAPPAGWLLDAKLTRLAREAVADGFGTIKIKVGARRRGRHAPGQDRARGHRSRYRLCRRRQPALGRLRGDGVDLPGSRPGLSWVEEPTSPDDILGHAAIRKGVARVRISTGEHGQTGSCSSSCCRPRRSMSADRRRPGGRGQRDPGDPAAGGQVRRPGVPARRRRRPVRAGPAPGDDRLRRGLGHDGRSRIEFVDHLHEHFREPVGSTRALPRPRGPAARRCCPPARAVHLPRGCRVADHFNTAPDQVREEQGPHEYRIIGAALAACIARRRRRGLLTAPGSTAAPAASRRRRGQRRPRRRGSAALGHRLLERVHRSGPKAEAARGEADEYLLGQRLQPPQSNVETLLSKNVKALIIAPQDTAAVKPALPTRPPRSPGGQRRHPARQRRRLHGGARGQPCLRQQILHLPGRNTARHRQGCGIPGRPDLDQRPRPLGGLRRLHEVEVPRHQGDRDPHRVEARQGRVRPQDKLLTDPESTASTCRPASTCSPRSRCCSGRTLVKAGQPGISRSCPTTGSRPNYAIDNGQMDATVSQPADQYAQYAVYYAKAADRGQEIRPRPHRPNSTIVDTVRQRPARGPAARALVTKSGASPSRKVGDSLSGPPSRPDRDAAGRREVSGKPQCPNLIRTTRRAPGRRSRRRSASPSDSARTPL